MSDLELREKVAVLVMNYAWQAVKCSDGYRSLLAPAGWAERTFTREAIAGQAVYQVENGEIERYHDWDRLLPAYESDIAAAWLVVERMRELGYWCNIHSPGIKADDNDKRRETWLIEFCRWVPYKATHIMDTMKADASTAPLAICRAAIAATEATR